MPIPHFVKLTLIVGEPIPRRALPEDANDPAVARRLRHEVERVLHELAHRAGIDVG